MLDFIKQNLRWLAACLLMYLCSCFGQTFFISLYATEIRFTFRLTHGEWGMIYASGTLLSALLMLFLGSIVDKVQLKNVITIIFLF